MKKPLIPAFVAFILGIYIYRFNIIVFFSAAAAALFLVVLLKRKSILILMVFLLIGYGSSFLGESINIKKYDNILKAKELYGYVTERQENRLTVRNYSKGWRIGLSVYKCPDINVGDYIGFKGEVRPIQSYQKNSMYSSSINAYVSTSIKDVKIYPNHRSILTLGSRIRQKLTDALIDIDRVGGGFAAGLLTGDTSGISKDDKESFSDAGLSHILAVSGFNLSIVYLIAFKLLRKLPLRKRKLIGLIMCLVYVFITGFEPSISRAFIMLAIGVFGTFAKRQYDAISAIMLTAMIMLMINPFYIYSTGFLLSFSACFGILLLKDDINDIIPCYVKYMRDEISVSAAAIIATFPILLSFKGYFSPLNLLFNILSAPLISLGTAVCFAAGVVYLITTLKYALVPAAFIGHVSMMLIRLTSRIKLLVYPGAPPKLFYLVYYALILYAFGYIEIKFLKNLKRVICIAIAVALVFMAVYKPPRLRIHMLNVGQGDSLFIETPDNHTILIDTGPGFEDYTAIESRVLPFIKRCGHDSIDMLIITHFHSDHCSGIDYMVNNFKVRRWVTFSKPEDIKGEYENIARGDKIKLGEVELNVLFPEAGTDISEKDNETCLVMELLYRDFSMLLTADAERDVMDRVEGDYDVFKLPHHGSEQSFSFDMADKSDIGCAVVSVGRNNYGHPSQKILDYLKNRGVNTYRTDENGNISIITSGKSYRVLLEGE